MVVVQSYGTDVLTLAQLRVGHQSNLYQHSAPVYQNNCICTVYVSYNYDSETTETFYDIPQLAKLYQYSF